MQVLFNVLFMLMVVAFLTTMVTHVTVLVIEREKNLERYAEKTITFFWVYYAREVAKWATVVFFLLAGFTGLIMFLAQPH